ncbi:MAG: AMP-binding protein [Gammaproteobacteria bacterium]|nr:AMP-binding protein [Gammaproteobacteria bacterium]
MDVNNCTLTILYQDKKYLWADLKPFLNSFIGHSSELKPLVLSKNKVFDSSILLINAFLNQKILFTETYHGKTINVHNIALAIATSGSQAQPKIALISRQNIFSHCHYFVKIISLNSASIWLNCMPLNHIAGVMIIYRCWFNNACLLLHQGFDAQKVWSDIKHYAVTHISLVPRMLFKLLEFSQDIAPPKSLKYALIGGDKISDSLYQRAVSSGWPIFISYGMTEASSTVAIGRTPEKLKIMDGFSAKLTPEGVLKLKGDMIFSGYTDRFIKAVKQYWFITEDKVVLEKGYLSIIGRNDNMIIVGGENIAPEWIESLLISKPSSTDFFSDIAIGYSQHENWGHTIIALFCVPKIIQNNASIEAFECWIKHNIPSHYQPRQLIKVNKIPRNNMGKIRRTAIQQLIINIESQG